MKNVIVITSLKDRSIIFSDNNDSFLDIFKKENIQWMNICGGKGKCTTCRMLVINGSENISKPTEVEKRFLFLNRLKPGERLACQAKPIKGNIEIKTPQDYKLPHINYSDD
ncbi:2Fe-2S iron-sulfur cluster-binding protein [Mangrovivirga sp. M17]|uniref:2Fe-2S iron-sulfur cluster-binding protein n=1 Tax=Mangrovivirga halotolerans TaxID=2993936 RepID=A0ABT3RRX0_9BACT|nr:2Fe-2S iron-sulfur cluster-binding protein [Mangrovivirga halotolerans]MCX2744530.1 2Fe-2S iron-sulfur cluster-binding protein [Mangrovivirga halotolerans]